MIYGQALEGVNIFDKLQAHGAADSSVSKSRHDLRKELLKAWTAKSVTAMNQDPWNSFVNIVVEFAELALVAIEQGAGKCLYFRVIAFLNLLGLLEEISGWIN